MMIFNQELAVMELKPDDEGSIPHPGKDRDGSFDFDLVVKNLPSKRFLHSSSKALSRSS